MGLCESAPAGSDTSRRQGGGEVAAFSHRWLAGGLLVSAAVVSLAACGGTDSAADGPLFTVVPDTISECGSETVVAEVSWDAEQIGIPSVRVEVGQLGNPEPKVFFVGDSKASMFTEQWVRIGTIFILVDGDTGKVLDSREVTGLACL